MLGGAKLFVTNPDPNDCGAARAFDLANATQGSRIPYDPNHLNDWGRPTRHIDTTTLDATISYVRDSDQPPAQKPPRRPRRVRDVLKSGGISIAKGLVQAPIVIGYDIPYFAVKGTQEILQAASAKVKEMAAEARDHTAQENGDGDQTNDATTQHHHHHHHHPHLHLHRPRRSSYRHHNYGDNAAYVQRLELMQEESILISRGKRARSNSVLHRTAHGVAAPGT